MNQVFRKHRSKTAQYQLPTRCCCLVSLFPGGVFKFVFPDGYMQVSSNVEVQGLRSSMKFTSMHANISM